NKEASEKAAQDVCRSVCDQFLVRIDVTATLHCSRFCCTECLGISDQHNGERTGRHLIQHGGIEVWGRQVGQPRWDMAGHLYPSRLSAEEADQYRGRGEDDERRRARENEIKALLRG